MNNLVRGALCSILLLPTPGPPLLLPCPRIWPGPALRSEGSLCNLAAFFFYLSQALPPNKACELLASAQPRLPVELRWHRRNLLDLEIGSCFPGGPAVKNLPVIQETGCLPYPRLGNPMANADRGRLPSTVSQELDTA